MTIRLAAVGDIMCGESYYQYGKGPRTHIDTMGEAFLDTEIVDLLKSHDIVFGNIECPISDLGWRRGNLRSHHMRAKPEICSLMKEWGINIVNVANNHILEQGYEAAVDTVKNLQSAGIKVIGVGSQSTFGQDGQTYEYIINDYKIGFIAGCLLKEKYAYTGGFNIDQIMQETKLMTSRCDSVIVSLHWGTEFMNYPNNEQKEIGKSLIESGASVILGHHPHVVQGFERVGKGLIAYSLGNFIFDQIIDDTRWSIILSCELDKCKGVSFEIIPFMIDNKHRPRLLKSSKAEELKQKVEVYSRFHMYKSDEYQSEAKKREKYFRVQLWKNIFFSLSSFPIVYSAQILSRPILRRFKKW